MSVAGEVARGLGCELRADAYTRQIYARDASMYAIEPLAVAFPRDAAEVAALVERAGELGLSLTPRGAGTSLAGQTVGAGVIVDLSRHMSSIVEVDAEARRALVQPGVVQEQLARAVAPHGLMLGADTSTSDRATIGGMVGNNSSGTHSHVHGTMIDHVRALRVVLADASVATLGVGWEQALAGRGGSASAIAATLPGLIDAARPAIAARFPPYWRNSGGYRLDKLAAAAPTNLAQLIVGSEGTLAVVTEAELDLVPMPAAQAIAVGHFDGVPAALAAAAVALGHAPAAIELMDSLILELARSRHEYARLADMLEGAPGALLFVTFFGETEAEATAEVERLAFDWSRGGYGYHTLRAVSTADRAAVLKVRKAGLGLLMAASSGTRRPLAFVEDTAVPPERLESYVARFSEILARHGMRAGFYGHCAAGCLHIRPFIDLREPSEERAMAAVAAEVLELALAHGGVNSSEHGDGLARGSFNERVYGPELYGAMRAVKALFDPSGVLNPGKKVDVAPMTEHLRDRDLPPAPALATRLRFGEAGMRGAADRCMNIGSCRKSATGVMCPSYMVTREEEHSTRGRASALVSALTQADPRAALAGERLHAILDLCLECKACKSECPLGVDVAALKSEALHQRQLREGVPARARLFGTIRTLNRLGCASAPLANALAQVPPLRALLERTLGVSARRPLPRFSATPLTAWHARRPPPAAAPRGPVTFLADSFTTYTEPEIGAAAIELLERAGWRVRLEARGCCGRANISKGRLDRAAAMAETMVERLAADAGAGVPIVGCEPSCLGTLTDEYLSLLGAGSAAAAVAASVQPLAALLTSAIDDGDLVLSEDSPLRGHTIAFHPHCHERAGGGPGAHLELLRRIPGVSVRELDAGCCGMAGSFGFETEHYDISLQIGELRLFPAVRALERPSVIAASGTSCRQQIRHGTGRVARHPVSLVRSALAP